jgi:uncharacterized membrane protein
MAQVGIFLTTIFVVIFPLMFANISGGLIADSFQFYAALFSYYLIIFITVIFALVFEVNLSGVFVKLFKKEHASIGEPFDEVKTNFFRKLGGMLWMALFISLWSLIPFGVGVIIGIVKSYAYRMTPYILAKCPNVKATEALKLSIRMTEGAKGDLFVLDLSFIGWQILNLLTLGLLGLFYVNPYVRTTFAGYYVELYNRAVDYSVISPDEFGIQADQPRHQHEE